MDSFFLLGGQLLFGLMPFLLNPWFSKQQKSRIWYLLGGKKGKVYFFQCKTKCRECYFMSAYRYAWIWNSIFFWPSLWCCDTDPWVVLLPDKNYLTFLCFDNERVLKRSVPIVQMARGVLVLLRNTKRQHIISVFLQYIKYVQKL